MNGTCEQLSYSNNYRKNICARTIFREQSTHIHLNTCFERRILENSKNHILRKCIIKG